MNPIRRSALIAVTSGVAVASLALPGAAYAAPAKAATPTTTSAAAAAAGYLARQMAANSNHLVDLYQGKKYADDGETADAVLSLDAAGVAQTEAAKATKWLETDATTYAGKAPDVYPGSAAKLLLVATAQHVNPKSFGGLNLIAALGNDEGAGGVAAGEYQNAGDLQFGSSVLDQALAVLALADASGPSGPSAAAVTFLTGQQCTDGAFEVSIRTDTTTACTASDNDVDTTAYAAQALLAAGKKTPAAAAVAWIVKQENSDGGWAETGGKSEANSTSIAVEALIASKHTVKKGEAWLSGRAVRCSAKAGRRGAVRYQGAYESATAIRATSQAGVALAHLSLAAVSKKGAASAAPKLKC